MNGDSNQNQVPQGGSQNSFWSRHSKTIIRLIIIAVIIVGAVIYAQTEPADNEVATENGQDSDINGDGTMTEGENGINVTDGENQDTGVVVTERPGETIRVTGERITVVVQKGNGYTHTARRALAQYLETHDDELEAEHKIYIEDYLQKKISEKKKLFVGDEVGFDQGEIAAAIDAAQSLTDGQVDNLSQYVPLVPGLM